MSRPVLIIGAVALVALLGYAGLQMLASDATKIRRLLQDAAASFDRASLSGCVEAFDPKYRDETVAGLDRPILVAALRYLFLQRNDPKTKAFLFRVQLSDEELSIQVEPEAEAATATFVLDLEERVGDQWRPTWKVRVDAKLRKVDGSWLIHRSSHATLAGKMPR